MEKTTLEILREKIFNGGLISKDTLYSWIEKLKEQERHQIKQAFYIGQNFEKAGFIDKEDYFNHTFKRTNE